jgi:hypothetical protein
MRPVLCLILVKADRPGATAATMTSMPVSMASAGAIAFATRPASQFGDDNMPAIVVGPSDAHSRINLLVHGQRDGERAPANQQAPPMGLRP